MEEELEYICDRCSGVPGYAPRKEVSIKQAYQDAANVFEIYADDQIAAKRWQTTQREKRDCDIRAETFRQCAIELREAVNKD